MGVVISSAFSVLYILVSVTFTMVSKLDPSQDVGLVATWEH
jgi:hypothetical protein